MRFAGQGSSNKLKAAANLLSAIICPLIQREIPQAISNLNMWQGDMIPILGHLDPSDRPRLIFSFSCAYDEEIEKNLVVAYEKCHHLGCVAQMV